VALEPLAPLDPIEAPEPEGTLAALEDLPVEHLPAVPEEAIDLVEALTTAWTTFTLYEDPRSIEAFDRSLETLDRLAPARLLIEILPDGFLFDGVPIPNRREAAQRMARQLFAHGAAAIEVTDPPTPDELLAALAVMAADPGDYNPNDRLRDQGVISITLLRRELLAERKGTSTEDDDPGDVVGAGDPTPGSFAHDLLADHGDDPEALARRFIDEYRRVYDLVDPADHWGREEVVHAFIDCFFLLPRNHQGSVLNAMVLSQQRDDSLLFIDQLGSTELGELVRHLTPRAQSLFIEYARVAAEHAESQHHAELLRLIAEAGTTGIGETVTGRVDAALRSGEESSTKAAVARLRAGNPDEAQHFRSGVNVMRGLLALASEGDMPVRLATLWAAKVTDAIRNERLDEADVWLGALGGLEFSPEHRRILLGALSAAVDRPVLSRILGTFGDTGGNPGSVLRRAAPLFITDALVDQIASEISKESRQHLTGVLDSIARTRPASVMAHLGDMRTSALRAVIGALGRSEHPEAGDPIRPFTRHGEPGVRAAAIEATAHLRPDECSTILLTSLEDPAEEVRLTAATMLAETPDHRIDSALIVRLDESRDRAERLAVVAALGRRKTTAARDALNEVASRFALRGSTRAVRRAAREALKGDQ
jgi:HEAT repeat protein